ncbi:hypothetical protein C3L33_06310, partial [Rhododendron williamsianum]
MLHPFAFMDPSGRLNAYPQDISADNNGSEVEGVECITASALHYVALAGPTLYGQVVNTAAEIASRLISYNSSKLIITDGVVTDLQETKDALVRASDLPFPVLIGGVGGADFKQMESSTGTVATRDIVQFVPNARSAWWTDNGCSGSVGRVTWSILDLHAE